jgi:hypothetical protein
MSTSNRAPITVDGVLVGYISLSFSEEIPVGMGLPPSVGLGAQPYSPGAAQALSGGPSHQRRLGGDHGSGSGHSHQAPHRRLGGPHPAEHRERHLDPHNRTAETEKAPHLTTADVAEKVHGKAESTFPNIKTDKHLDRSRFDAELKAKPWLRDKAMRIMANEQGDNPEGTQAIIESAMNRAEVRGTSLEQQLRWHESEGGYYQQGNMGRGALENKQHREVLEHSLSEALSGSNISNYATDNSSGALARREAASGAFRPRSAYTGESFFSPGTAEPGLAKAYDAWLAGQQGASGAPSSAGVAASGKPVGVTRLGPAMPMAQAAPSGDLEYLASRGGHSSVNRESKPVGATMGFDPELAARLHAAGVAYEHETGDKARYGEGDRDVATQQYYWEDSAHGTRYRAAPPGYSEHQKGKAMDLPDSPFRGWLKKGNMNRFGLHFPVSGDAPHVQADPKFKGSLQGFNKAPEPPAKTADSHGSPL